MFATIDEVISYWQVGESHYEVVFPGSSIEQIEVMGKNLEIPIHDTLRELFQKVNGLTFKNLHINGLESFESRNTPDKLGVSAPSISEFGYWEVGSSDGYFIFVDVHTGEVHAWDSENTDPYFGVAETIEQFICIAASVVEQTWPIVDGDEKETLKTVDKFLSQENITQGYKLWRSMAMDWM